MKLAFLALSIAFGVSACKSAEMSGNNYNTGAKRDDGTGDKDDVEKNSAFKSPDARSSEDAANGGGLGNVDALASDGNDAGANPDQGDETAEASVVDVLRLCSNRYTEQAQTNLKAAQNGVIASLIPADGKNTKSVHFDDQASATRIREEVMNYGRFQLPLARVPGGTYELHLCDARAADACRNATAQAAQPALTPQVVGRGGVALARPQFTPFASKPGLIGTALLTVQKGRLQNITGALLLQRPAIEVLTDVNKQQSAMMTQFANLFGQAIAADTGQPFQQVQADLSGIEDCDDTASPLIVDLGNEGIDLSPPFPGKSFDIDADGKQDRISWPLDARTMFLALDLNGNGVVDDAGELFGNNSRAPMTGEKSANGFLALAKYDENKDGFIDRKDEVYFRLRLWSDANADAVCTEREMLSLSSQGVDAIDLRYREGSEKDAFGNLTKQRSTVRLKEGKLRLVVDLWFRKS